MNHFRELWQLGLETFGTFTPRYQTAMIAVIKATGVNNGWRTLSIARGCDPEPLTREIFDHLYPFESPATKREHIENLLQKGFLEEIHTDTYVLTKQGRKAINRIFTIAHREIGKIQAIPFHEMKRLANLLEYVVAAALRAPEPVNKCSVLLSRWTDIGGTGPSATRIDQYLTDLQRFRADCQIASWKHYHIDGYVWETFSALWRGDANTIAGIAQHLSARGYTVDDYACAMSELMGRGWVEAGTASGTFVVSPKGMAVRGEAERVTDQLFFAPWQAALSPDELDDLHDLFMQVLESMRQLAA